MTIVLETELRPHVEDHLHRDRCRPGDRQPQAREVEVGEIRVVEDGLEDRRRAREHADALLDDTAHHRGNVEHRVRDDRRALQDARQDPRLEPERVEERVHDEVAVAGAKTDDVGPRVVRADARRVEEHRPFGRPVVPDVKRMSHRSSGWTASARDSAVAASISSPRAMNSSHDTQPSGTAPRSTIVSLIDSDPGAPRDEVDVVGVEEVGDGEQLGGAAPHRSRSRLRCP